MLLTATYPRGVARDMLDPLLDLYHAEGASSLADDSEGAKDGDQDTAPLLAAAVL